MYKDSIGQYLTKSNYEVAPVTMDNDEDIFANAYYQIIIKGEVYSASLVKRSCLQYMSVTVNY